MKRITHFKGYDSCVEYDPECQTFVTKPFYESEAPQTPVIEVADEPLPPAKPKPHPQKVRTTSSKNARGNTSASFIQMTTGTNLSATVSNTRSASNSLRSQNHESP